MYHFALIGHPVGHSLSGEWMRERFAQMKIDADYTLVDLPSIADFPSILASEEWHGFNVTIPHKTSIIPYLDSLSPTAQNIGAVNTIEITPDHRLIGHNTDAVGFRRTLKPHIKPNHRYQTLVLGTGGASLAVRYVLQTLDIEYKLVSRNSGADTMAYSELNEDIVHSHHLIINTTPLGMHPNTDTQPDIPYHAITSQHILYDLVYNPFTTKFLNQGIVHGGTVVHGLDMLHAQADAALDIWLGI